MAQATAESILEILKELREDVTLPKNIKIGIGEIISQLERKDTDLSVKVNDIQHKLDEIANDINLEPHARSQLWLVASMLETL